MPTERWQRVERIFAEALALAGGAREEHLDRACAGDAALRDEVASLLRADEKAGDFLEALAIDVFAGQVSRDGWSVKTGDRIASYTIGQRLGTGGMGEVWRARDERLGRDVAIKLLLPRPGSADEFARSLQHEARAAGALNHTNVLTVFDIGDHGGAPYLVTECLEGEPLSARLRAGALGVDAALDVALQVARGLAAAHAQGIVHRDLKPANIFLAGDGRAKILDFGLATLRGTAPQAGGGPGPSADVSRSLAAGTPGYMAPEQMRGEPVDVRADIFALGAVLHEMLAGRAPFAAESTVGTLNAVLTLDPPDLATTDPRIPRALARVVERCLAKSADDRFPAVSDVADALEAVIRARRPPAPSGAWALVRRPAVALTLAAIIVALAVDGWRWQARASRIRWARTVAAPEIERLTSHGDVAEAFLLARQALAVLPDDRQLFQLWLDVSMPTSVNSEPAGADVAIAPFRAPEGPWLALGRTPLAGVRVPRALVRMRVTKPGLVTIEGSASPGGVRLYRLEAPDALPAGMVRVVGGDEPIRPGLVAENDDFWIDRFEVTNRAFKDFVDQGGYRRREYWREPFVRDGRALAWEDAVATFRDASGAPGPATWSAGTYPEGQADFPVGGVSWYEAAAYAVFAGKSLPTIHHWYRAAGLERFGDILTASNFRGQGPAPVGSHAGLGPFGTYDMAGNVKEWCSTDTGGHRFLLGGSWNESMDTFLDYDARPPFERAPSHGFRLVQYAHPLPPAVAAPVPMQTLVRDVHQPKPVGEDVFALYRRLYAYDPAPLNAVVEATEETDAWSRQTVAFDAAYGRERMRAHLFLPRNGTPPYQTVVFLPAGDAFVLRSSRDLSLLWGERVILSGRAFLYPVYKDTFERATFGPIGPNWRRELYVAWSRDLGRAIDYLHTRPDIDRTRLGLYGVSVGADVGVIVTALEPRIGTGIFQGTGIGMRVMPEIDPLNFAPRIRVPVLMLNGRFDPDLPFGASQLPLFERLGSPAGQKRHVVLESGHVLSPEVVEGEVVPWLDRTLGPVAR